MPPAVYGWPVVDIVKLQPADRDRWQTMFSEFLQRDWPDDQYDWTWARLAGDREIHALGARVDGELIGFVHFFRHAHTNAPDVCCIHHLYTSANWRGRGVARALIA